ncbi:coiled-coil domain-containing protein 28B isoform X6 [Leptonychotes weddellii]|uniref:Coiled-coil domain-containing protein 28B isoform X6 n=1 Tax=Leptonychotes weddellii TaxID=9713 RepID=A0A7F8QUV3_LEPWE|nr:coiled-coil domain-containing protein 28B isoform X6 [Leptonychotes weddellii]
MEDKKKKRSPKPCLTQPAQAPGTLRRVPVPTSHSGSLALGLPHLPSPKQRAKFKRVGKEKCRPVLAGSGGCSAGTPLQHSFLTEVTDVYEMEGGLLNLLNDFHSGRLQAFGDRAVFGETKPVQDGQTGLERLGSKASQSLTGTDRSCIWPRTPSLRSSQPCRCRTQAQTAPLMPFKL